jgi:hypothetical protein
MEKTGVFKRNFTLIMAVAMVMLMVDLVVSAHVLALTNYLNGEGYMEYSQAIVRYLVSLAEISAVGFFAGLLFCVGKKVAWYAGAVCVAGMFIFQANIYFTDYTWWGLIDAAMFMFPRLLLIHLLLLAAAPIGAAVGAEAGTRLHLHVGQRVRCPREI